MMLNSPAPGHRLFAACLAALIAVFLISASGFAQTDSNPKWDAFIGYQYLHPGGSVPAAGTNPNNPMAYPFPDMSKGIGGALTYNFDSHW